MITAQQAAKLLLDGLSDPDYGDGHIEGFKDINWQSVYDSMTNDHNESMEICGSHDWPSLLIAALTEIANEKEKYNE
jgi:hypothetical protein